MAPESERATCGKQMSECNYNVGAILCNREANHDGQCSHTYQWQNFTYQQPTEPTLTCSEVVERLPMSAREFRLKQYFLPSSLDTYPKAEEFAEAYAKAILHSWRERRVQELEQAVKIASCQLAQGSNMDFSDANMERWQEEAQRIEQQLLIEAGEQIRKGAKHE